MKILHDLQTVIVTIEYDLVHGSGLPSTVTVEATSNNEYWVSLNLVEGDVGSGVSQGSGKQILWNAGEEWPAELFLTV